MKKRSADEKDFILIWCLNKSIIYCYEYSDDIEEQISFNWLIRFAYISFIFNLLIWFLVPILLRHPDCGKGLHWAAHIIFWCYIIFSLIFEFTVYRYLFNKKSRESLFKKENSAWFTYFTMCVYWITGLIGKGDVYTDISFLVEMEKWNEQRTENYRVAILTVALIVFLLTIAYQIILFVLLTFKSSSKTFWPLTAHTTRLLLWGDNKMLATILNKYTITYYNKVCCWRLSTHKILLMLKLILEDFIQWSIQITYLALSDEKYKNIPLIIMSLCFTIPCILVSIVFLIIKEGSPLNNQNFEDLRESNLLK